MVNHSALLDGPETGFRSYRTISGMAHGVPIGGRGIAPVPEAVIYCLVSHSTSLPTFQKNFFDPLSLSYVANLGILRQESLRGASSFLTRYSIA